MTLLEVEELTLYWVDHPPLHLMVASYLGVGKGSDRRARPGSLAAAPSENGAKAAVGALLAELGPSFAGADVHAGLAPVVLDFAELRRGAKPAG